MTWLDAWWDQQRGVGGYEAWRTADPGLPGYPWLPDGTDIVIDKGRMPVSFVDAARNKYHALFNWDQLHRATLDGLKTGKWDTRTPAQRRSDDWAAYQAAKKRWDRDSKEGAGITAAPQEQAEGTPAGTRQADGTGAAGAEADQG